MSVSSKSVPASRFTRGRWFVQILIALSIVSVPLTWVLTNYEGQGLNQTYTMSPVDGWCDAPTEGLGVHCFGDFQLPRLLSQDPATIWTSQPGVPQPYTPLGMVPHLVTDWVAHTPFGVRGSLALYLVLLAAALLVPAAAVAWRGGAGFHGLLPILLIGVATAPFIINMDRGNSVGFVAPALLVFAWTLRRGPVWVAPAAVVVAASFRPQFALLAIAFLALGRFRSLLWSLAAAVLVQLITFAAWPGGFSQTFDRWWTNISRYGFYVGLGSDNGPANLSAANAVTKVAQWFSDLPGPVGSLGRTVVEKTVAHPAVPGYAIAAAAAVVLLLGRGRIPYPLVVVISLVTPILVPAVSFTYYLIVALVIAVLLVGPCDWPWVGEEESSDNSGLLDSMRGRAGTPWAWLVIATSALSLIPLTFTAGDGRQAFVLHWIGLLWTLSVLAGLAWVLVRLAQARWHWRAQ